MTGELPRKNPGHQLPLLWRHYYRVGLCGNSSALCGRSRLYVTQGIAGEQNTYNELAVKIIHVLTQTGILRE